MPEVSDRKQDNKAQEGDLNGKEKREEIRRTWEASIGLSGKALEQKAKAVGVHGMGSKGQGSSPISIVEGNCPFAIIIPIPEKQLSRMDF